MQPPPTPRTSTGRSAEVRRPRRTGRRLHRRAGLRERRRRPAARRLPAARLRVGPGRGRPVHRRRGAGRLRAPRRATSGASSSRASCPTSSRWPSAPATGSRSAPWSPPARSPSSCAREGSFFSSMGGLTSSAALRPSPRSTRSSRRACSRTRPVVGQPHRRPASRRWRLSIRSSAPCTGWGSTGGRAGPRPRDPRARHRGGAGDLRADARAGGHRPAHGRLHQRAQDQAATLHRPRRSRRLRRRAGNHPPHRLVRGRPFSPTPPDLVTRGGGDP